MLLSEAYILSCFLSELKEEIRLPVRMFNPNNLLIPYSLSKILEENVGVSRKNHRILNPHREIGILKHAPMTTSHSPKNCPKVIIPIQKIKPRQKKERRDKDPYRYIDSKWNPDPKCQQPKLFLMEKVEEEPVEIPEIE